VVVVTVVGFAVGSLLGVAPVWVATVGAVVLAGYRLAGRRTTVIDVVRSASPSFCLFVFGLGIVVSAVSRDGLGRVVGHLVPSGTGFLALLGIAAIAAVLSNLMNNLPATLLLLPIAAVGGVGPALAVLIGVDIGPNLTYPGSLATLLWRRAVDGVEGVPSLADFTRLGVATAPAAILGSTAALWLSLRVVGS
jgi:arsenical pump membrane protein